jgi:hypothetical protein
MIHHFEGQDERGNLESSIRMEIEAIDAWSKRFDVVNSELAEMGIGSGIQITTPRR